MKQIKEVILDLGEDKEVNFIFKNCNNCVCGSCFYISGNKVKYVNDVQVFIVRKSDDKILYKTSSDEDGKYYFSDVRPNKYYLKAIAKGYQALGKVLNINNENKIYLQDLIF